MKFFRPAIKKRKDSVEIYPEFIVRSNDDLMIRGRDFYAVWDEENGYWSTNLNRCFDIIDNELKEYSKKFQETHVDTPVTLKLTIDASSGVVNSWNNYIKKSLPDDWHQLDAKLVFANDNVTKKDYVTKKLNYNLEKGNTEAYDELLGTLYTPEELDKLEWAIGSIIAGDSRILQKAIVLSGDAGTGKSTFLKVLLKLFGDYAVPFDAKALVTNSAFALEPLKDNPIIAYQDDAELSKIEDNVRLNSLISHEALVVNEKYKSTYEQSFQSFIFLGTNKDVQIREIQSGLLRRIIDVAPSGKIVKPYKKYMSLLSQIDFEKGAICYKCYQSYIKDPRRYDNYIPTRFIRATNFFYNYIEEYKDEYEAEDGVNLQDAWSNYQEYVALSGMKYPLNKMEFKRELSGYFKTFIVDGKTKDGKHIRNRYVGFKREKLGESTDPINDQTWLTFDSVESLFDITHQECDAQYAKEDGSPKYSWSRVKTKLSDIDTKELHWTKLLENEVVLDFDMETDDEKDYIKNLEAASNYPKTYAELSKSGAGIHLHYIYDGDVTELASNIGPKVEIKTFQGNSSLRRKLTRCNDIPIAHLPEGSLPRKEKKPVLAEHVFEDEQHLRNVIIKCLKKDTSQPYTKPCIDLIKKSLDDAYNSGMKFDVTDLQPKILTFATKSHHQQAACLDVYNHMIFRSDEPSEAIEADEGDIIFFDCEVFPNLFIVCWKKDGPDNHVNKVINPSPEYIQQLCKYKLVGFNNRTYDNQMFYARIHGYTNYDLYKLSQRIINKSQNAINYEACNLSYTDIYDFSSAMNKKSLKKWEIELGIHHQEFQYPWDQPVPEDKWKLAADYCANDVLATQAVFHHLSGDFKARQILAKLAGMTVNDTTNNLTKKLIFGDNKNPQGEFIYTHLEEMFPGYKFDHGKSSYRDVEEVGEGGYVYAEPGMYVNTPSIDVAGMHPESIIQMQMFGERYTKRYKELRDARLYIKHKEYDKLAEILDGQLIPFISEDPKEMKDLSNALKTALNSVYGLTAARFDNPFRDPRNIDNIVAKRGALFMIDLRHAVQEKGYTVVHIKTDSIKIANADQEIIDFVTEFGAKYGYQFEIEDWYDRICLVNNAVYIAREKGENGELGKWTATGAQFAHPYVFKRLFTKEDLTYTDLWETKSVQTTMYLDFNEENEEEHHYEFVGRTGAFCPILPGKGGGILVREGKAKDGTIKYDAVVGTKGYRWKEGEVVRTCHYENDIDMSYFEALADEAKETISKFGNFDWFVSNEPAETFNPMMKGE